MQPYNPRSSRVPRAYLVRGEVDPTRWEWFGFGHLVKTLTLRDE
jgi:hypothetical protein